MNLCGLMIYTIHRVCGDSWCLMSLSQEAETDSSVTGETSLLLSISIHKVSIVKNLFGTGLLFKTIAFQFWYFMLVSEACISISLQLSPLHRWFQQLELASLQMMPDAPSLTGSFSSLSPTFTQTGDTRCPLNSRSHPSECKYTHPSNAIDLYTLNKWSQACFHKLGLAVRT